MPIHVSKDRWKLPTLCQAADTDTKGGHKWDELTKEGDSRSQSDPIPKPSTTNICPRQRHWSINPVCLFHACCASRDKDWEQIQESYQ